MAPNFPQKSLFQNDDIESYTEEEQLSDVTCILNFFMPSKTYPEVKMSSMVSEKSKPKVVAKNRKRKADSKPGKNAPKVKAVKKEPSEAIRYYCDLCGDSTCDKGALARHKKKHDESTKIFKCAVCQNSDNRQRSNWMQHVVTHIGETIPPEIYNNLDIVTKTLVDGTHAYVTEKMLKKRLAIAEKRKKRKNRKNH